MQKTSSILRKVCLASIINVCASFSFAASSDLSSQNNLVDAAQRGNLVALQTLLKSSTSQIDATSKDGMTALLWATQSNNMPMMEELLSAGADANIANRYHITPLWLAAINHNPELVALLINYGADVNTTMPHGETALMVAARVGDAESIDLLLAAGADPNARETSQGETALMWAAAENHGDAIRRLIRGGANPNLSTPELNLAPMKWVQNSMVSTVLPVGRWTAAMFAARQGSSEAIIALAELGANINAQDQDGSIPLTLAIINAHYDLAAILFELGASPDISDRTGMNALYAAIDMVSHRKDIGRPKVPARGTTKAIDLVQLFLSNGAEPNAQLNSLIIGRHHNGPDKQLGLGATALMRAAKHNDLESMRFLLEAGANPHLALEDGTTVFNLVAEKDEAKAVLREFAN